MTTRRHTFRVNVSWDAAILAVERATREGRREYTVRARDNGYLRLRTGRGISISIQFRVESPQRTVVAMVARQDWRSMPIGKAARLDKMLAEFREDVERQLVDTTARQTPGRVERLSVKSDDTQSTFRPVASSRQTA